MKIEYTLRGSLSSFVNDAMRKKHMTQADLIEASLLSRTTINRICRNSNDKESTYQASLPVVQALSIGLKLTRAETLEMLYTAFPEMELWGAFLDQHICIDEVNLRLDEAGLPLWGSLPE